MQKLQPANVIGSADADKKEKGFKKRNLKPKKRFSSVDTLYKHNTHQKIAKKAKTTAQKGSGQCRCSY
jgi:hypothetical protein